MDFDRIHLLLKIVHKTVEMPNLSQIKAAAFKELAEIEASLKPKPEPYVKTTLDNVIEGSPQGSSPPKSIPSEPTRRL